MSKKEDLIKSLLSLPEDLVEQTYTWSSIIDNQMQMAFDSKTLKTYKDQISCLELDTNGFLTFILTTETEPDNPIYITMT